MKVSSFIILGLLVFFRTLSGGDHARGLELKPAKHIKGPGGPNYNFKSSTEEIVLIRILAHLNVQSLTISPDLEVYEVFGDGKRLFNTNEHPLLKLSYSGDSIEVKTFEINFGRFKTVKVSGTEANRSFKLKLNSPDRKARTYQDNLIATVENGNLKLLNDITLDNYISGVVQAEAGRKSHLEFYKVQSILARTFALSHLQKHVAEGFSLCDQTHCQAYFGKTTEVEINKAVSETRDIVVVDENLNLIDAAFHSNSGGETVNSEDVWGRKLTYLRSVNDSFSVKMPNARWERKMAKEDWLSYLKLKHNYPVQDSNARWKAITFTQETRKPYLEANNVRVPLKNVRTDFQLKSTFFTIIPQGDSLLFKGRGFGHGVGMCQEGAMRMAKLGYKYTDVIRFYYQNIQLIDLHKLNFFKDE
ncbi:MAG: SpoIID/LytB domain-containing protein [Bacteroidetes bacterium]|nr:SpoIID/LytB domain-containing protein [Bacteroidota bacterium]